MLSRLTHNLPPITGLRWFNLVVLILTPLLAAYGLVFMRVRHETVLFSIAYYVFSMLGEGHRFFFHILHDIDFGN